MKTTIFSSVALFALFAFPLAYGALFSSQKWLDYDPEYFFGKSVQAAQDFADLKNQSTYCESQEPPSALDLFTSEISPMHFPIIPMDSFYKNESIHYFTKEGLESLQVFPMEGKIYQYRRNTLIPYDSKVVRGEPEMFVVDSLGNTFIHRKVEGKLHHSSFFSTKPVAYAGQIEVRNGEVLSDSNMSGHYKPPRSKKTEVWETLLHRKIMARQIAWGGTQPFALDLFRLGKGCIRLSRDANSRSLKNGIFFLKEALKTNSPQAWEELLEVYWTHRYQIFSKKLPPISERLQFGIDCLSELNNQKCFDIIAATLTPNRSTAISHLVQFFKNKDRYTDRNVFEKLLVQLIRAQIKSSLKLTEFQQVQFQMQMSDLFDHKDPDLQMLGEKWLELMIEEGRKKPLFLPESALNTIQKYRGTEQFVVLRYFRRLLYSGNLPFRADKLKTFNTCLKTILTNYCGNDARIWLLGDLNQLSSEQRLFAFRALLRSERYQEAALSVAFLKTYDLEDAPALLEEILKLDTEKDHLRYSEEQLLKLKKHALDSLRRP